MIEKILNRIVFAIEITVTVGLVALSGMALVTLGVDIVGAGTNGLSLSHAEYQSVISTVLEVFILIELFNIAIAYMRHRNVIPTVMEAALIAVARKFVVFEPETNFLQSSVGLAALLVSIAVAWWLLSRANACELNESH